MKDIVEIERKILGSLISNSESIYKIHHDLKPEDFIGEHHSEIYQGMKEMYEKYNGWDLSSFLAYFNRNNLLGIDQSFLMDLSVSFLEYRLIGPLSAMIVDVSNGRMLKIMCTDISLMTLNEDNSTGAILQKINTYIDKVSRSERNPIRSNDEITKNINKRLKDIADGNLKSLCLSGIPAMDRYLSVSKGELIVIASGSGVGKSLFANTIATNIGDENYVLYMSLEMADISCAMRMISAYSGLNSEDIRDGKIDRMGEQYEQGMLKLRNSKIIIDDSPNVTIGDIEMQAFRLKREKKLDVLIIDHGMLMNFGNSKMNLSDQIGLVSKRLKSLAKSLDIVVLLLWQTNKEAYRNQGGMPSIANISSSGRVVQDCDRLILLWDANANGKEQYEGIDTRGKIFALIAKNRWGEANKYVPLKFEPEKGRFSGLGVCEGLSAN